MRKRQGYRLKLGVAFAACLTGALASAQAGEYSNVYFFGDSSTDVGTFSPLEGQNTRFTTKPGTVWAENVAAAYGKQLTAAYTAFNETPSLLGFTLNSYGNDFAVGAARINAEPTDPAGANLPSATTQVNQFLLRGPLDPGALYGLAAGANDIFTQFNGGTPLSGAPAAMATASHDLAALVTALETAGARHLIVLGVVDISVTPFGLALTDQQRAQLISLKATFDTTLASDLAGGNLLYFDTGRLIHTVLANPLAYGFTNTTAPACPNSPPASAMVCQVPADGHMWADDKHPSSLLHGVISDWVYSSLEGARRAGQLSTLPLERSGTQWLAIDGRLQEFQNFGYRGQGVFFSGDYTSLSAGDSDGPASANKRGGGFAAGYQKAFAPQLFAGATIGFNHAPFDLGNDQGSLKYDEWAFTAFTSYKLGAAYANVLASYSRLDFQSERNVVLGSFNTTERGGTTGNQFSGRGQIGYNFVVGNVVHGPLAGLTWERVNVDGFSEDSGSVTAMAFGDQTRESLRSRIGWQATAETTVSGAKMRPFVQLTYDCEHNKDEHTYRAGFAGGFSAMEMPMANRTGGYGTFQAGVDTELSPAIRLGVSGSTTISQPDTDVAAVNITLSASF